MTEVRIVCEGFLRRENGVLMEAHSTSTLISSDTQKILVDTSSFKFRPRLIEGLQVLGITPKDIDIVVCTHLHHDHVGNIDLFPEAVKLARKEEVPGAGFESIGEDRELGPGIRLMHTPGHTRGSMSVVVDAKDARYVIAGDAVPTKDNYEKWVPPMIKFDEAVALRSMRRIVDEAEVIVPGHGAAFPVDRSRAHQRER